MKKEYDRSTIFESCEWECKVVYHMELFHLLEMYLV